MLKDILAAFKAPAPALLTTDDQRLALAALMVRLARADDDYATSEAAIITALLQERYGLSLPEADALRLEAEDLEVQAPDTVRFTKTIKETVPYEERADVIRALWSVVMADNIRDADENSFMRVVSSLLGVKDRDSNHARRSVTSSVQS